MPGGWWEGTLKSNGKTGMFPDNFVRVIDTNEDNAVTLRDKSATTNRRCKVIYSYTQVNDDELSLAVGDIIEFLGEVEEGWWRGRLKNKIGVFPSNFVVNVEPSPILACKRPPSVAVVGVTTAKPNTLMLSSSTSLSSASAAASTIATKKTNRYSFHSSKEDLLNTATTTTTSAAGTTTTATVTATSLTLGSSIHVDDVPNIVPSLPPKPQREYCRVEFPYAPQNDDELELKVGDIITIITTELPDKGWWKGELRGKVGVFPDNFVKMMAPSEVSPLHDSDNSHKTAKSSYTGTTTINNANQLNSATAAAATSATSNSQTLASTTKVFIKKSGSSSSTQSSNRKDSFGSRDSLNDILSETGLTSGNVAAQRKSLENKNLDLTNAPDSAARLGLKKQPLVQLPETKTLLSSSSNNTNTVITTTTTTSSSNNLGMSSTTELRKSLESVDEKTKTPPPVLTKKPSIPLKKTTTVQSVAGNILSGFKQKVKTVESKLTTTASHDYADGISSSKMSPTGVADSNVGGNIVMRRAATIAVEDSDFDRVERASMLQDMRAGRVRAPKRRPPSSAINIIGESNNNSLYLNGSGSGGSVSGSELTQNEDNNKPHSSDENSVGEEQLAKPKPREWEKRKAPWMEELKASQEKKKTSPNIEPRTLGVTERTSKLLGDDTKITNSNSSSNNININNTSNTTITSSSASSMNSSTTKIQSSSITSSSVMQQSMIVESSNSISSSSSSSSNQQQTHKKELNNDTLMAKSFSSKSTNDSSVATTTDDARMRPNSLSIRNRSISPSLGGVGGVSSNISARTALKTTTTTATSASPASTSNLNEATNSSSGGAANSNIASSSSALPTTAAAGTATVAAVTTKSTTHVTNTVAKSAIVNNHHNHHTHSNTHENNISAAGDKSAGSDSVRVVELEKRVEKLEGIVHTQQRSIDELMRTLREEVDRVKVLRGELDKYAQCVTQV